MSLSRAELERHDPHPRGHGSERRFLCPFSPCRDHQGRGDQSFCANTVTGLYFCHRCGARGKLTDYRQLDEQKRPRRTFHRRPEASSLPKKEDIIPALQRDLGAPVAQAPIARAYLEGRGIPVHVAAGVTFCPTWCKIETNPGWPAVVFPLRSEEGVIVAAHGRAIRGDGKVTYGPKRQALFETAGALRADTFAIAEAPLDALSLAACGLPAVAVVGTTLPHWLRRHVLGKRILVGTDSDEAGEKAALGFAAELEPFGAKVERLCPPRKDWNEVLSIDGAKTLTALLRSEI